jgi:hypothetical protein
LNKEIAEGCTTGSDTGVPAVLNGPAKILHRDLGNGGIVRFGDFGSLRISLTSDGAETAEKIR